MPLMHYLARLGCAAFGFASVVSLICALVWSPAIEQFLQDRWFALLSGIWAGASALLWLAYLSARFRSALCAFCDGLRAANKDFDSF